MRDEREYGLYWYSGQWNILRPILIACATLVVVIGLIYTGWTKIYDGFLSPMEPGSTEEVAAVMKIANKYLCCVSWICPMRSGKPN